MTHFNSARRNSPCPFYSSPFHRLVHWSSPVHSVQRFSILPPDRSFIVIHMEQGALFPIPVQGSKLYNTAELGQYILCSFRLSLLGALCAYKCTSVAILIVTTLVLFLLSNCTHALAQSEINSIPWGELKEIRYTYTVNVYQRTDYKI